LEQKASLAHLKVKDKAMAGKHINNNGADSTDFVNADGRVLIHAREKGVIHVGCASELV